MKITTIALHYSQRIRKVLLKHSYISQGNSLRSKALRTVRWADIINLAEAPSGKTTCQMTHDMNRKERKCCRTTKVQWKTKWSHHILRVVQAAICNCQTYHHHHHNSAHHAENSRTISNRKQLHRASKCTKALTISTNLWVCKQLNIVVKIRPAAGTPYHTTFSVIINLTIRGFCTTWSRKWEIAES